MQHSVTVGKRIFLGMADSLAIHLAHPTIIKNIIMLAINTVPMIAWIASGFCRKSSGPGCKPCTISAPRRTAPITLPGIPSEINGIKAPPTVALLAASEAMIPSSLPFPNLSGFLDALLAAIYAARDPMLAPIPGRMPIKVPITDDRMRLKRFETQTGRPIQAESFPETSSTLPSLDVTS